jgi:hypothetical protein
MVLVDPKGEIQRLSAYWSLVSIGIAFWLIDNDHFVITELECCFGLWCG